jgi:hypothetical protein
MSIDNIAALSVDTEFGHLVAFFFMVVGIATLVFPYRVQRAAVRKCTKFWGFPNPFLGWMETRGYIWMLRVLGSVSIAAAVFIELVFLFGGRAD